MCFFLESSVIIPAILVILHSCLYILNSTTATTPQSPAQVKKNKGVVYSSFFLDVNLSVCDFEFFVQNAWDLRQQTQIQ